jgi:hypothetical protein
MRSQAIDPIQGVPEAGPVTNDGPSIVELPGAGPLRAARGTDRWLGAVIAVCAAVVCLGFVGRAATPPAAPGTQVESPADTTLREIAPESSPAPATTIPAGAAGSGIPAGSAVSAGSAAPASSLGSDDLRGAIAPVSIWHLRPVATGSGPVVLTVDGYAPSSIEAMTVMVWSRSGALLRSAVAHMALEDERPGSGGQQRLGLGTFHLRIVLATSILVKGCLVETEWHDGTTDSQGSTTQVIPGIGG